MNNQPIIQVLSPQDVLSVVKLQSQSTGTPWTKSSALQLLEDKTINAWGVCAGDTIIGFIMIRMVKEQADIIEFVVDSVHRRQGAGQKLYQFMETICLKNKLKTLFLEVSEINHGAQKFYEKEGFLEIAVRQGYYKSPEGLLAAILMKKELLV